MTKPEFVVKWRERLCWLGLRGLAFDNEERVKGPFKSAEYALAMPDKIEKMLAELWDDVNESPKSPKPLSEPPKPPTPVNQAPKPPKPNGG